jgi:lipoprotein-anchoring transpeptidase ErfK/SrfK
MAVERGARLPLTPLNSEIPMHRILVAAALAFAIATPASSQSWVPWHQPSLHEPSGRWGVTPPRPVAKQKAAPGATRMASRPPAIDLTDDDDDTPRSPSSPGPALVDGGAQPDIAPKAPGSVTLTSGHAAGTILIDTSARRLYLVQSGNRALAYPISVGREGFTWTGTERISRVASWPDWHPPAEMRERDPRLPVKMTGGVRNPLGAKALYLGSTLYRIHGTSDSTSIGRAASSGCFRMHNAHVVDLAGRVGVGTRVVVVGSVSSRTAEAGRPAGKRTAAE